jgi:hypothetical protein
LRDLVLDQLDVEGVLAFVEYVMVSTVELGLDQKQQLQKAVFPSGLQFDGERFGTAVTCLAFKKFGEDGSGSESASPRGTDGEWKRLDGWLAG